MRADQEECGIGRVVMEVLHERISRNLSVQNDDHGRAEQLCSILWMASTALQGSADLLQCS